MFNYLGSSDLRTLNLNVIKLPTSTYSLPEYNIMEILRVLRVWKSFDLVKAVTISYYLYYLLCI